jgi:hypothetical protein
VGDTDTSLFSGKEIYQPALWHADRVLKKLLCEVSIGSARNQEKKIKLFTPSQICLISDSIKQDIIY